jgi:DNA-binding Lrp family transcriptional regulator
MQKSLDFFDLKILEGLGIYGPRNVTAVARKLNTPEATLRRRLKRMLSQVFLCTNVYHTNIGLRKVIVFASAFQGNENMLYRCLDAHDYLIYISRSFGAHEGCTAIFAVPTEHSVDFEEFLRQLETRGVAENIEYHWSTCFQTVNMKCDWYDRDSERWVFFWDDWIQEVQTEGTELPFTLIDPLEYRLKADATDIFILKELELDATISLREIATKLNTTTPSIKYHFDKHIIKRQLLEGFQVIYYPFDRSTSNGFFFMFTFKSLEKMAKFARSLLNKPFALSLGKVFGKPSLFAYIYLPLAEFRRFIDSLGRLVKMGFLARYDYVFQDMAMTQRYTIPYKSFRSESWLYEREIYLDRVDDLIAVEKADTENRKVTPSAARSISSGS